MTISVHYFQKIDDALNKISYKSNMEVLLTQPDVNQNPDQEKLDTLILNEQQKARSLSNVGSYKQNTFIEMLQDQQSDENTNNRSNATVRTPYGTYLSVLVRGENLTDLDKYYMEREIYTRFPGVIVIAPATSYYNCLQL